MAGILIDSGQTVHPCSIHGCTLGIGRNDQGKFVHDKVVCSRFPVVYLNDFHFSAEPCSCTSRHAHRIQDFHAGISRQFVMDKPSAHR
jgi:hypothetical protein